MRGILLSLIRVVTFRATREEVFAFGDRHLVFGVAAAWLAGIGRTWDNPKANVFQFTGLASVLLAFCLSSLLWGVVAALRPQGLSWKSLAAYVGFSAPLAWLYAVPVERFTDLESARVLNVAFLAVVALWRVALWFRYLAVVLRLGVLRVIVAGLLPLALVVTVLTLLNLEHAVFDLMSGMTEHGTRYDASYRILVTLTMLSVFAFPVIALGWISLVVYTWWPRKAKEPVTEDAAA